MKLFQWVKEIRSKDGRLHFKRFAIIETPYFALYIHRIYEHDRDPHLHSHPWNFKSIILKGSYLERYLDISFEEQEHTRVKRFLSYSSGNRLYYHKIDAILNGPVTTLFFTYGKHEDWYYRIDQHVTVKYDLYRELKNTGKLYD